MSPRTIHTPDRHKRLVILGSTGSIGVSALQVVDAHRDHFDIVALSGYRNVDLMEEQARRYMPRVVAMGDKDCASELTGRLRGTPIEVLAGSEGLVEAATHAGAELMLSGIVGGAGLLPTLEAVRRGIDIAFVNKEVLVIGGELITRAAADFGARILPVDSEISAIFQCLECCSEPDAVRRVYLTASGGPFRTTSTEDLRSVTPEQALKHPNWTMGSKVTIDSATLMNKGFEVIESQWLFGLELEQIRVVVHPQSVVHSYVEFVDGAVIAQLGVPDMRIPIQYALMYPERRATPTEPLDLIAHSTLTFENPDVERFPCLSLAYDAAEMGGTMPAVLSGADEVAVEAFLSGELQFHRIPTVLRSTMEAHDRIDEPTLDDALNSERWAREAARERIHTTHVAMAPRTTGASARTRSG